MRTLFILGLLIALLSTVAAELEIPTYSNFDGEYKLPGPFLDDLSSGTGKLPPSSPPTTSTANDADDALWTKASCRGHALLVAMTLNEQESSRMLGWPYTQSPWTGSEFDKWGYTRDTEDEELNYYTCNFARYGISPAFRDLNVDMRPAEEGGPNHCFSIQHQGSPMIKRLPDGTLPEVKDQWFEVDGVWYRSTGGFARVGINVVNGIIYFLARSSPEIAAESNWGVDTVPSDALPKLRSSSDLTWAFWNQVASGTNSLQNIKYFIAMQITNDETLEIVMRALKAMGVPDGEAKLWPGTAFTVGAENDAEKEAADALIGSPNGLAAGYFLLQHKQQLGGAKYIWKVVVFDSDPGETQLLFYVDADAHPQKRRPGKARAVREAHRSTSVKRSGNGNGLVREHVFRARL